MEIASRALDKSAHDGCLDAITGARPPSRRLPYRSLEVVSYGLSRWYFVPVEL